MSTPAHTARRRGCNEIIAGVRPALWSLDGIVRHPAWGITSVRTAMTVARGRCHLRS